MLWPSISRDGRRSPSNVISASGPSTPQPARRMRSRLRCAARRPAPASTIDVQRSNTGAARFAGRQESRVHRARRDFFRVGQGWRRRGADHQTAGEEGEIAWAPDSRRIVYVSDRDGTNHLFLYDFSSAQGDSAHLRSGARQCSKVFA